MGSTVIDLIDTDSDTLLPAAVLSGQQNCVDQRQLCCRPGTFRRLRHRSHHHRPRPRRTGAEAEALSYRQSDPTDADDDIATTAS
jgi:hypothetical protein